MNEFSALIKALFRNEKGKPYPIDSYMCNELFMIFNQSGVRVVIRLEAFHEQCVNQFSLAGWQPKQAGVLILLEQLDQKG